MSVVIMVLMVIVFIGTFRRWSELLRVKTPVVDEFGDKVLVTVRND
jgi:carbon starvation protein